MKNSIKKIKFRSGQDANQALMRKLSLNFIKHGRIDTTVHKAKALKGHIDRLVHKAQKGRESDKNVLLKHLADKKTVQHMIDHVGPSFKRTSGFVTIAKLGKRQGDDAEMARLSWIKDMSIKVTEAPKKKGKK